MSQLNSAAASIWAWAAALKPLPFLPDAASMPPRTALSDGETPFPDEGDKLAVVDTEEATPASSSVSSSFSLLAQALRHSLLQSSRRRPDEELHLTGVDLITLEQFAQVPFIRAFLYSERHISEQNSLFPELVGKTYFSWDLTSEHQVQVRGFLGGRPGPLPGVGILLFVPS